MTTRVMATFVACDPKGDEQTSITYDHDDQPPTSHDVGGDVLNVYDTGNVGAVIAEYFGSIWRALGVTIYVRIDADLHNVLDAAVWRIV